jgi:hypothetical protein
MTAKNYEAWDVQECDYPSQGTMQEKIAFLLRYAILAPSGPNTQPWKFAVGDGAVSVFADLKRSLPFVDPSNRTLFMSVGCGVANLLTAGAHFGFQPLVSYFPRGQESDLVAEVKFKEMAGRVVSQERDLFLQILKRHTTKDKYADRSLDESVLKDLEGCIDQPGFHVQFMTDELSRSRMADLVSRSHHAQLSRKEFRRNLGEWLRNNWTTESDGMPLYTFGVPDAVAFGFPAAFKEFDLSEAVIYRDSGLIQGCGALGVLSSDQDDKLAWVKCGVMLEKLLLKATGCDLYASFFSQPIGIPELRGELEAAVGQGHPQLLFSLGHAKPVRHTPRRRLEDVMREN